MGLCFKSEMAGGRIPRGLLHPAWEKLWTLERGENRTGSWHGKGQKAVLPQHLLACYIEA